MLHGIDTRLHEIKGMMAGMYDQITDLTHTTDAVFNTVNYHVNPRNPTIIRANAFTLLHIHFISRLGDDENKPELSGM